MDDKAGAADPVRDKDPEGKKKKDTPPAPTTAPAAPTTGPTAPAKTPVAPPKKKVGVESFWVNWEENPKSGPTVARLKLTFQAKFKDDASHDPALAEFRQRAFHRLEVTGGPNKGKKSDDSPLHDDHYSRADDIGNHTINDIYFLGNDAPGGDEFDKDDVIKFSFTAEQRIIDTSDNKVIKTLGPHTAGITGKHPRKHFGVPKMIGK